MGINFGLVAAYWGGENDHAGDVLSRRAADATVTRKDTMMVMMLEVDDDDRMM